jgi:hypothetical protein
MMIIASSLQVILLNYRYHSSGGTEVDRFLGSFNAYCTKFWVDFAVLTGWVCSVFSNKNWSFYY